MGRSYRPLKHRGWSLCNISTHLTEVSIRSPGTSRGTLSYFIDISNIATNIGPVYSHHMGPGLFLMDPPETKLVYSNMSLLFSSAGVQPTEE